MATLIGIAAGLVLALLVEELVERLLPPSTALLVAEDEHALHNLELHLPLARALR